MPRLAKSPELFGNLKFIIVFRGAETTLCPETDEPIPCTSTDVPIVIYSFNSMVMMMMIMIMIIIIIIIIIIKERIICILLMGKFLSQKQYYE